jgi:hypothetical protein
MKNETGILTKTLMAAWAVCMHMSSFAQDSARYSPGMHLEEGIYFSFDQFRKNQPLPSLELVSKSGRGEPDFIRQTVARNEIIWKDSAGKEQKIPAKNIWGISENGSVHIMIDGRLIKLIGLNTLTHFLKEEYVRPSFNAFDNGGFGAMRMGGSYLRELVFDARNGSVSGFEPDDLAEILSSDAELLNEYSRLKKRNRRNQRFMYLRRFNERHPLYFPLPETGKLR